MLKRHHTKIKNFILDHGSWIICSGLTFGCYWFMDEVLEVFISRNLSTKEKIDMEILSIFDAMIGNIVIVSTVILSALIMYKGLIFSMVDNVYFKRILSAPKQKERFLNWTKAPMWTSLAIIVMSFWVKFISSYEVILLSYTFLSSLLFLQFARFIWIFNIIFEPEAKNAQNGNTSKKS